MTKEEKGLLQKLATGTLDGFVGDNLITSGKSMIWKSIKNGVPAMFKQGPDKRIFKGL